MKKVLVRGLIVSMAMVAVLGSAVAMHAMSKASNVAEKSVESEESVSYIEALDEATVEQEIAKYSNFTLKCIDNYSDVALSDDASVEEVKAYFLEIGFNEEDLDIAYICSEIETLKQEYKNEEDVVEQVDQTVEEWMSEATEDIATCSNPIDAMKAKAAEIWYNFKYNEKRAYVMHPVKALKSYVLGQVATEYTIQVFGINGLGDPSDAFRHAMWCALMARDIGHKYSDLFATAHENNPLRGESDICADGYKLDAHREMDLHNNQVGMSLVSEYDTKETASDEILAQKIFNKLKGVKSLGLVWLHY